MRYGFEPSDPALVTGKSANQGPPGPAEPIKRRAGAQGNSRDQSMRRPPERGSGFRRSSECGRPRSGTPNRREGPGGPPIPVKARPGAYLGWKRKAAPGVDGVTGDPYADGQRDRLTDRPDRVPSGVCRALPIRRVYLPQADGSPRPLGIEAREDQIVQQALGDLLLTPIYEAEWLGFSYGFRPPRSVPNARDARAVGIKRRKVNGI